MFTDQLKKYGEEVSAELERAMRLENTPELLKSAMRYSIEAGGKRIRPCLALAVSDMLSGRHDMALTLGCALEMIHTYSLIHDDLPCVDNDDMRRGRPSNHKVFGEGQAVFAGDALLTYAFEYLLDKGLEYGSENYYRAAREIAVRSGASGMVAGQSLDLEAEKNGAEDEASLLLIHKHKTADMLSAAVLAGAYSANASKEQLEILGEYAEKIGLLFQIADDILDAEGDEKLMGKTLGKDRAGGKLTFVNLYGLEKAREYAESTAREAEELLRRLPGRCDFLRDMIFYIKDRKN